MAKSQPIPKTVIATLEKNAIPFRLLEHRTVFTAYDLAATLRRAEKQVAKALVVKAGAIVAIAVMSADRRLDTVKLGKTISKATKTAVGEAKILNEKAAMKITNLGDRPTAAFGTLYGLPVVIDELLAKQRTAIFPSGSVNASLEINLKDYMKQEDTFLGSFTVARPAPKKKAKKAVSKKVKKSSTTSKTKKTAKKVVKKPLKKILKKTVKKVIKKTVKKSAAKKRR